MLTSVTDAGPTEPRSSRGDRLRRWVALVGAAFFVVLAIVAAYNFAADLLEVGLRLRGRTSLPALLAAGAVIVGGGIWIVIIARLAGAGRRSTIIAIVAALATLLVIRIAISILIDASLHGEPGTYNSHAKHIVNGICCLWDRPINRPPGYSFLLAAAFWVGGISARTAEWLNILMALATGLLVFDLGRRLYGIRVGTVALLLYALWPAGALMIAVRIPHTSYELAIIAATWAVVVPQPGWRGSALGGAILGLSQYLRPTTLVLVPFYIVARVWHGERWRRIVTGAALPLVAAYLLVLVPIMAWNLSTRGVPDITTSAHGGNSLFYGTDPASGGRWSKAASDVLDELAGSDTWERSRVAQQLALDRIRADPLGVVALAIRKQGILWGSENYGVQYALGRRLADRPFLPRSTVPSLASGAFWVLILAATAAGLYLRRQRTDALGGLLVMTVLAISVAHGFLETRDRYHSYVVPLMLPIAALAMTALVDRFFSRRDVRGSR